MDVEKRLEILSRYIEPGLCSDGFDRAEIRLLLDQGYLRSGFTPEFRTTLKTTEMGRVYLRSYGRRVRE